MQKGVDRHRNLCYSRRVTTPQDITMKEEENIGKIYMLKDGEMTCLGLNKDIFVPDEAEASAYKSNCLALKGVKSFGLCDRLNG